MKKICLTVVGMYFMLLHAFSQVTKDTTTFRPGKLKLDEVNLVSSYYKQDGDHSAVRGGSGAGTRLAPPKGIFGTHLSSLELRCDHYTQTTDLVSDVISLHLQFK